jgi:ABC-2 type transport system permease protein
MQSFLSMLVANLRMTVRNRQAIFWNLAFPALFILIFGAVFDTDQLGSYDIGVSGSEHEYRDRFIETLDGNESFTIHEGDQDAILNDLEDGEIDVALIFGEPSAQAPVPVRLVSSASQSPDSLTATEVVRGVLLSVTGAAAQVEISSESIDTQDISFIDFFVPGIVGMSLMNSGIIGLATTFVAYRERGILRRIKVTPFPLWKFTLARIASNLVVAMLTSAILIGMGVLVWGMEPTGNPLVIALAILVGGLAFLAIGFLIAAVSRNVEVAASYANLITFPMLFLSGVFFPLSSLPGWLASITQYLPLRYLIDALREVMNFGNGITVIWGDLLVLTGWFVVAMLLAVRFFRWDEAPK